MKAIVEGRIIAGVQVLAKRKTWFGFGREESLVEYTKTMTSEGKILYTNQVAEWVPSSMVFD